MARRNPKPVDIVQVRNELADMLSYSDLEGFVPKDDRANFEATVASIVASCSADARPADFTDDSLVNLKELVALTGASRSTLGRMRAEETIKPVEGRCVYRLGEVRKALAEASRPQGMAAAGAKRSKVEFA